MRSIALLLLSFSFIARPALAQTAAAAQPLPTSQPMNPAALAEIYRTELGQFYTPDVAAKLPQAHALIELYFEAPGERKKTLQALAALNLDANLLGRITRIRMNWPDLHGGVYYINEKVGPLNAHYFLGIPKSYDRSKPWPLVIKLPAADAFVTKPAPDADEVKAIYIAWMTDELSRHPDAVVVMPLLHLDELWGPSYAGMNTVTAPMQHVMGRVNVDPSRVYMVGHSMSAHAAWNLALHYPTYFAGFVAMAGGAGAEFQRLRMMNLRNVLPVVWHDAEDKLIKVDSSRRPVQILRGMKIPVEYEETRGIGHVPSEPIVERIYERLRQRARELYPKWITMQSNRPDTMFNRIDWLQIYQPLRPGEEKRVYFRHGSGYMKTYPNLWKVEAKLQNNRITATTDNVQAIRFYLNDQMIDFSSPVTVVVNKRGRFEGLLKPDLEEMLKDQLILGRGWRYYTAVVDVDLGPPPRSTTKPATQE